MSGDWDISIVYPDSYTEDQYWLECESYSGSGNANVRYWAKTVNGDVNIDRLATIVVSSTTHKNAGEPIDDYEIPVTQRKFSFNITGDTTMSYYAVDSSSKKISIDCSVAWQATASENWVIYTPSNEEGRHALTGYLPSINLYMNLILCISFQFFI